MPCEWARRDSLHLVGFDSAIVVALNVAWGMVTRNANVQRNKHGCMLCLARLHGARCWLNVACLTVRAINTHAMRVKVL
jgi:hypothetical protein